jgi:hypothetical protein
MTSTEYMTILKIKQNIMLIETKFIGKFVFGSAMLCYNIVFEIYHLSHALLVQITNKVLE